MERVYDFPNIPPLKSYKPSNRLEKHENCPKLYSDYRKILTFTNFFS